MIQEIMLGMGGLILLVISIAIVKLGAVLDKHPKAVSKSEPSLASPVPATKIAAIVCWVLFLTGVILLYQGETVSYVFGIVSVISAFMIAFTTAALSMAVISRINAKKMVSIGTVSV
jgi:hypothetical protein